MAKLRAIAGGKGREKTFSLVYGLRLYPTGDVAQVGEGKAVLRDKTCTQVPLHLIEGTRAQIRAQLLASIDAFFDIHADDKVKFSAPSSLPDENAEESGC